MPDLKRYRLVNLAHRLPMPDRGGREFARDEQGEMIDVEDAFWRTVIADKDLIPVTAGNESGRAAPNRNPSLQRDPPKKANREGKL